MISVVRKLIAKVGKETIRVNQMTWQAGAKSLVKHLTGEGVMIHDISYIIQYILYMTNVWTLYAVS